MDTAGTASSSAAVSWRVPSGGVYSDIFDLLPWRDPHNHATGNDPALLPAHGREMRSLT
ncbi:MAG: hypothetical protein QGI63_02930 [Rhodospirillales bacterium]|nr:hypothetical protein [Rhodospirillales bacterium]MDP6773203.1 hypothetical protein [Rhodospirillales bacterium]